MSEERKAYVLDFKVKPPKAERKRRGKPEYQGTIDAFIESGNPYAKVGIPKTEKLSNVQIGLKSAIVRMGKDNEIKAIRRKGALYLVTRTYSDKQGWIWKIIRKRK